MPCDFKTLIELHVIVSNRRASRKDEKEGDMVPTAVSISKLLVHTDLVLAIPMVVKGYT